MIAKIIQLSIFLVIVRAYSNDYCKSNCVGKSHIVCIRKEQKCGTGFDCGEELQITKLTDDNRQFILDLHNTFRNKVAAGDQEPQPSAANMKAMSYNKELEFIAQCSANSCILNLDACRDTAQYNFVGQNIGKISSPKNISSIMDGAKTMIMGWFNEVGSFNKSSIGSFIFRSQISEYSQVVWANTVEIGCGITSFRSFQRGRTFFNIKLVCNYGPGGNIVGQPVYIKGKPASKCSGGKPNKKYEALCGEDKPLNKTAKYENDFFNVSL